MKTSALLLVVAAAGIALGDAAIAPKFLWTAGDADALARCLPDKGVRTSLDKGGLRVDVSPECGSWPGVAIVPAGGTPWDAAQWGHIEARLDNLGETPLAVSLRIDNPGDYRLQPWNSESVKLNPGESRIVKVIYGYQYGFHRGYKLDPSRVSGAKVFLNAKPTEAVAFRVSDLQAAGPAGETPPVNPRDVVTVPPDGTLLPAKGASAENIFARNAAAVFQADGTLRVETGAKGEATVLYKPKMGAWNLKDATELRVTLRNTGKAPLAPRLRLNSYGESVERAPSAPVAPGGTATVVLPFVPDVPWRGRYEGKGKPSAEAGTGTKFQSHRVSGLQIAAGPDARFDVLAAKAVRGVAEVPRWVGRRPPVEGDWVVTFEDDFDGDEVDRSKWTIYTANYWDPARTHFTKDNIWVKDGKMTLHLEKKRGHHNDDPNGAVTDYATGFASTFGTFAQRYGYFEARMKVPTKPGVWSAFWTMPDRGPETPGESWRRWDTHDGGMEIDIMEHLTAWGPHRFNIAAHWDGYGKDHKALGTDCAYVPPDKDGFFTIGLLWQPGRLVYYGNGVEFARWEDPRVCSVPAYLIFDLITGGWANEPLDDALLPDEFVIDYVRCWQERQ